MNVILRKATVADIKPIHGYLLAGATDALLLPRSLSELYGRMRDFIVLSNEENAILGCCALSVVWDDMAEIRSLFVDSSLRGKGYGRKLVEACMREGTDVLGIDQFFTLTYQREFFQTLGFEEVGKEVLPQKIWADCIHCPKFPDCDEIAMVKK